MKQFYKKGGGDRGIRRDIGDRMGGWAGNIRYSILDHVIHCVQGDKNMFNQGCHNPSRRFKKVW